MRLARFLVLARFQRDAQQPGCFGQEQQREAVQIVIVRIVTIAAVRNASTASLRACIERTG